MRTAQMLLTGMLAMTLIGGVVAASPAAAANRTVRCAARVCNFSEVQAEINAASAGDTVWLRNGTLSLAADQTITINKALTFRGVKATIQKAAGNVGQMLIAVTAGADAAVTIEGFILKNSGSTSGTPSSANSALVGIEIARSGVADDDRSYIRNNTFIGFTDSAIVFSTAGAPTSHWTISRNVFINVNYAIFNNGSYDLEVLGNRFESYIAGMNNTQVTTPITDFRVEGNLFAGACNTFVGPGGDCAGGVGSRGLNLNMNAGSNGDDLEWLIANNKFLNHTGYALRFKAKDAGATGESMTGVFVMLNQFTGNTKDIENNTGYEPAFALNYWGGCEPVSGQFSGTRATQTLDAASVPWIKTFSPASGAALVYRDGFYPMNLDIGVSSIDACD